jgi:nicotinamidase-related amidase
MKGEQEMQVDPIAQLGLDGPEGAAAMALVVVDMQYFDAHRDWGEGRTAQELGVAHLFEDYFAQIDQVTPVIGDLLAACRARGIEVIHLRVAELTSDSRDVGYKQLVRGLIVPSTSKEAELLPGLEPLPDEIVISKSSSGVFAVTSLDRTLRNLGIRTLVFTGTSTGGCVQSAVYDATDLGYRVAIVTDACADSTSASHAACLEGYRRQSVELIDAAAVLQAVAALPLVDRAARSGLARVEAFRLSQPWLPNGPDGPVEPYAAIFGPAVRLDTDPAQTALLMVDTHRLALDPVHRPIGMGLDGAQDPAFEARAESAVAAMATVLSEARLRGLPVIHARTCGNLVGGRDLAPKNRARGIAIGPEESAAGYAPLLAPRPGEAVLNKPGSSAFNGTGLDQMLRNMGVQNLIVVGVSADSSLEATLRSAGDRDYGTVLVPEALLASPAAERSLTSAERGIINFRGLTELFAPATG